MNVLKIPLYCRVTARSFSNAYAKCLSIKCKQKFLVLLRFERQLLVQVENGLSWLNILKDSGWIFLTVIQLSPLLFSNIQCLLSCNCSKGFGCCTLLMPFLIILVFHRRQPCSLQPRVSLCSDPCVSCFPMHRGLISQLFRKSEWLLGAGTVKVI